MEEMHRARYVGRFLELLSLLQACCLLQHPDTFTNLKTLNLILAGFYGSFSSYSSQKLQQFVTYARKKQQSLKLSSSTFSIYLNSHPLGLLFLIFLIEMRHWFCTVSSNTLCRAFVSLGSPLPSSFIHSLTKHSLKSPDNAGLPLNRAPEGSSKEPQPGEAPRGERETRR